MKKYLSVFKISFAQEFTYRVNFVLWRVRNILQIFLVFFLWDAVFKDPQRVVFGYDRARIFTYVFGLLIVKAIVFSSRSIDISGEIARGDISNFLLKPLNYLKYWFVRDTSSKVLNLLFAFFETLILYIILKPPFFLQTNVLALILFILSLGVAVLIYYFLLILVSTVPFWFPEQGWGAIFLLTMFTGFLSGGVFPIDILPGFIQRVFYLTPFPYLIFTPLQIYLGKFSLLLSLQSIAVSLLWTFILYFAVTSVWNIGLKAYRAEGR